MPGRVDLLELLSGRVSIEPYRNVPIRPAVQSQLGNTRPRDALTEHYGPRKHKSTLRLIEPQTRKKMKVPKEATEYTISPIHFETLDSSDLTKDQPLPPSYNAAKNITVVSE
ncbi:hypothetical protein FGIG_02454 [Fasciola gigantica]|uniref:Uncharacterized protein n=1 Tax=Fasciola gigantica TaxID=46835 RepID=A0A504YL28_FASGI|nr:hypothetical protein FGIG_02454 [Fasciola gigantica]